MLVTPFPIPPFRDNQVLVDGLPDKSGTCQCVDLLILHVNLTMT